MPEFCHLHCHTQYSLLDGAARIKKLVGRAAELEIPALAITDHGNLFGVPEFYTYAKQANVQPIIGCEFYVTPSGMGDTNDRTRYHQVLLAKDEVGYRNLIKLSSMSYTDGFYYKPRIDRDTLRAHSEGLVATTCCLQGEVLQTILNKGEVAGLKVFKEYLDIFGEDYYIEIQDHGIPEQRKCNAVLLRWAEQFGVKVVATNDVHYVEQDDAAAQDVLLCLQTGRALNDPTRMRFENDQFFLKSAPQMQAAFADSVGDALVVDRALDTTREIADKCRLDLQMGTLLMPHFPLPEAFELPGAYLRHLVYEGAKVRYGREGISELIRERLDYELKVISEMGFDGYFLIVQDFTTAARDLGVSVGPGRGSAAGSCVAYCLGITNIDPLQYDLLFERFLNPERISMPDIDIDFDDRGRAKVIDYVVQKYGRESVCQIVTFGTMGSKSVIRDVARVLDIPLPEADRISKLVPDGVKVSLEDAKSSVKEFAELYKSPDPQIRKLMHYATVLEGSARHTGVHAAGVIIAPGDVSQYVPVSIQKGKGGAGDAVVTQYDGKWIEEFGLLKMDFLGLKTLTVLDDALALIKTGHGVEIDLDSLPLDDEKTYKLFQKGDTVGIFQFESEGMREWMRKLKPTGIDDLIAMNALYRPGPMDLIPSYIDRKHGREEVEHPHPMLAEILEPTYGIPVYQEQVMQMAQVMGGYTLGGADLLRRAMGKKKQEEMDTQRVIFVEGATKKDVDEKTANEVFDMMAKFAGYGFNKSHSAAYSLVAYHTAYLKAHYPAEFMAAVLTNEAGDSKKLAVALDEARRMGLDLLPPCVNRSEHHFNVEVEDGQRFVRYGLYAVKTVGAGAIEAIVNERAERGPYESLFDFCKRVDLHSVNKTALEALTRAGAFDFCEAHRAQLSGASDDAYRFGQQHQVNKALGQNSLFGGSDPGVDNFEPSLPHVEPWTRGEQLRHEKELMGFYVSGHPLDAYEAEVNAFVSAYLGRPDDIDLERDHKVCGIITEVKQITTKAGKPMAFLTLEDQTGQGEVVLFTSVFERHSHMLRTDEVVMVRGQAEVRGGSVKIKAQSVDAMWKVREEYVKRIILRLNADDTLPEAMDEFYALCQRNKGPVQLLFDVETREIPQPVRLRAQKGMVEPTPELMQGMYRLFGRKMVALEGDA
ncbi:MAG: DNA polymerase III subunit alpha [Rhodothermales bacterium]